MLRTLRDSQGRCGDEGRDVLAYPSGLPCSEFRRLREKSRLKAEDREIVRGVDVATRLRWPSTK